MGQTTGADLVAAFAEGRISSHDWAHMINQCRACGCPEKCEGWLALTESAERTPEYCANAAELVRLRGEIERPGN